MTHKSKLQINGEAVAFLDLHILYVSRIRSNLNNMALMCLKLAFKIFKLYSQPLKAAPGALQAPDAPVEDGDIVDDFVGTGEDGLGNGEIDDGNEAAGLEKSLSDYLARAVFGYATSDDDSEDDEEGALEQKQNEPNDEEAENEDENVQRIKNFSFEDPYIPFWFHSALSTEIKYRRMVINELSTYHPRKLKLYGEANVARNFVQTQQLFTEQINSNATVCKGLYTLEAKNMFVNNIADIPSETLINLFIVGADAMPRTAETTSTLVLLAQGGNPGLSKNPGLMRQLLVGDIDEKSVHMRKYFSEQLEPYAKLLDENPEKLIFQCKPYFKRATGWPMNPTVDEQNFPYLSCLNEFVIVPDLKSMGEICGDGGVTNQYPLGNVAVEKRKFGESLLVLIDRTTEVPSDINDGLVAYLVNPAKHNQLLDICYFRTPEEIDALWNDIEQKAKTIIDSDPDKYRNLTYEQLRDTDDPLLANVYKSLRKKLLVYANEKERGTLLPVTDHPHMSSKEFEIVVYMQTTTLVKEYLYFWFVLLYKLTFKIIF